MKIKPIIGIVAKYKNENDISVYISENIKNAVVQNGGIAIGILPPFSEKKFLDGDTPSKNCLTAKQKQDFISQIKLCDGIIFEGGPTSMEYEPILSNYTFEHDIPTLGFCAGQNNLIRGVGGTTKPVDNIEKHYQKGVDEVHKIFINTKSQFYNIVKCKEMMVNSSHKRTIDNPTNNYTIAAICDDGYYDVLEAPNKKFNIAIRFHPEKLYKKYSKHNAIFKAFISACKH